MWPEVLETWPEMVARYVAGEDGGEVKESLSTAERRHWRDHLGLGQFDNGGLGP